MVHAACPTWVSCLPLMSKLLAPDGQNYSQTVAQIGACRNNHIPVKPKSVCRLAWICFYNRMWI